MKPLEPDQGNACEGKVLPSLLKFSFRLISDWYHADMKLIINNQAKEVSVSNISELLLSLNLFNTNGIAIAVNEKVVPKNEWGFFTLNENDKVLIIQATQGG